jgi:histidyl-tRNA synthetase
MRVTPISGFPEWSPEGRIIEQQMIDQLRRSFESFGFAPIETRALEPLEHLLAKGETSKEVYTVQRLQAEEGDKEPGLGLHFDLTVPFARYVLENRGKLQFPFKRYQIQKVWRGERPQRGRYREFYQADIDVIGRDKLPLHFDAEIPLVVHQVLSALPIPKVEIHVNNRKLIEGFYRGIGIEDVTAVLHTIDKLAKIGADGVFKILTERVGVSEAQARQCLALAEIQSSDTSFAAQVRALGVENPLLEEGIAELSFVIEAAAHLPVGAVQADLALARGLDYYTGTVYECFFVDSPEVGAVCSGGRYDNLASGGKVSFPGVGVSVGLTRILGVLFDQGKLTVTRPTPTCVLVALVSEEKRAESTAVAAALRARGVNCEVFHERKGFGKQIKYASQRKIPYVWFPAGASKERVHRLRDIRTGAQVDVDPITWMPSDADLLPRVEGVQQGD